MRLRTEDQQKLFRLDNM